MSEPAQKSMEFLEQLVSFDTTSYKSNLPLINLVRQYLVEHGVESTLIFDDTGRKANHFATLGPSDRPGYILSGHTDVVPVDDQPWSSDPFTLTRRDNRLFGRGTSDMKTFAAVALALVPEFLTRRLAAPIHIALSYDEEVGCLGVRRLIADLNARGLRPRGCIVGEPTGMTVISAHKGRLGVHVKVRGLEAHTGAPHLGVNAIEIAAEVISCFRRISRRLRDDGPHDLDFVAPNYATIQVSTIRGGTAANIVPANCEFDLDIRYLPGQDPLLLVDEGRSFAERELLPEMRSVSPTAEFFWETSPGCASFRADDTSDVVELAKQLSGANQTYKVGFGTEAGLFQDAGIPTVVCGPGHIEQAHKPDEYVEIEQLALCERFLRRLLDRVSLSSVS